MRGNGWWQSKQAKYVYTVRDNCYCQWNKLKKPKSWEFVSLMAQMVKNLPAMQEIWVQFLGREDPLEKELATHSSILAWRTPCTEEPGGLQSIGSETVGHDWVTNTLKLRIMFCSGTLLFTENYSLDNSLSEISEGLFQRHREEPGNIGGFAGKKEKAI